MDPCACCTHLGFLSSFKKITKCKPNRSGCHGKNQKLYNCTQQSIIKRHNEAILSVPLQGGLGKLSWCRLPGRCNLTWVSRNKYPGKEGGADVIPITHVTQRVPLVHEIWELTPPPPPMTSTSNGVKKSSFTHIKDSAHAHARVREILAATTQFMHSCKILPKEKRLCCGFFPRGGDWGAYGVTLML